MKIFLAGLVVFSLSFAYGVQVGINAERKQWERWTASTIAWDTKGDKLK